MINDKERIEALRQAIERMTGSHTPSPQFPDGHIWSANCDACQWRQIGERALADDAAAALARPR